MTFRLHWHFFAVPALSQITVSGDAGEACTRVRKATNFYIAISGVGSYVPTISDFYCILYLPSGDADEWIIKDTAAKSCPFGRGPGGGTRSVRLPLVYSAQHTHTATVKHPTNVRVQRLREYAFLNFRFLAQNRKNTISQPFLRVMLRTSTEKCGKNISARF